MKMMLAMVATVAFNIGIAGVVLADPGDLGDPCEDENATTCPTSPDFDPWAEERYHQRPTSPNPPTRGPICQDQVGEESIPPGQQFDGCILPGGPVSPGG